MKLLAVLDVLKDFVWLKATWDWLTTPSIMPWVGVVAALAAGFTIATRTWIKSLTVTIGRSVKLSLVWLVVAWLLTKGLHSGFGGNGWGGTGGNAMQPGSGGDGPEGSGNVSGDDQTKRGGPVAPPSTNGGEGTPEIPTTESGLPVPNEKDVWLEIRFIPLANDPTQAQDFACDLSVADAGQGYLVPIRASDMQDFDKTLVQELRKLAEVIPDDSNKPTAIIHRLPFPGDGVLRRVKQKMEVVLPRISITFDS